MDKRIQIETAEPSAFKGMFGLENYLQQSKLSKTHKELIKIRASQINGCAFCINMHTKDALKNGEDQQRIFLLDAWGESNLYAEEEKIILQITEEVTIIHCNGLTNETYEKAIEYFDEHCFSQIIMAVTVINPWNRIAISTNKPLQN